jgi:hypothetical protein
VVRVQLSLLPWGEAGRAVAGANPQGQAMTARLYVTDPEGTVWRVLDVRFALPHHKPGEWSFREPPDPAATFRTFVGKALGIGGLRVARNYRWRDGESRTDLTEDTLLRQQRGSQLWDRRPVTELIPRYQPTDPHGTGSD